MLEGFVTRSHEAVREWYARARCLFQVETRKRRAIAVDETKVKVQRQCLYVWAAIDIDTWEVLYTWVSQGQSGFEVLVFLRRPLEVCDRMPVVYVDRAPWYLWALDRLGSRGSIGPSDPAIP